MKKMLLGMVTAIALVAVGCGANDNNNNNNDAGTNTPDAGPSCTSFQQPDGTIALNFTIDATGRPDFYQDAELEWKGNFQYDVETRIATNTGSTWEPPFAPMYDDGPWTCGGHEPKGAVAGDEKFGITMFFAKPTEDVVFSYGAQLAPGPKCANPDGCWIWTGDNGGFTVPANATADIDADGLTLAPEGNVDIRISLDTTNLPAEYTIVEPVGIKGSYCDWNKETVANPVNGVYTYVLSASPNCLMASPGTLVKFVWTYGEAGEYKLVQGVTAATKGPSDADWVPQTVAPAADNGDPSFTIPE